MKQFKYAALDYCPEKELLIWKIKDTGMPSFSLEGVHEFREVCRWIYKYFSQKDRPLKFIVSGSEHQGIYNMGGDLGFFLHCIRDNKTIYNIYNAFGLPAITIAGVEGNAYGGGFECALAHDFILATENAKFCLPENQFNLFPGMGAYSLLLRKAGYRAANEMIKNSRTQSANELKSQGLIHEIVEDHKMAVKLNEWTDELSKKFKFEYYHIKCKKRVNPLFKKELLEITDLWVEACMKTEPSDFRKMEVLVNAQVKRSQKPKSRPL